VEVEVTAEAQADNVLEERAQLGQALVDNLSLIRKGVAGVGCADDIRDSLGCGLAGHGQGGFEVGRAVVYAVNQMVMNVDHCFLCPT
jgi:hypothetical protein